MKQTTKCILCLKKATCHAGHVITDEGVIIQAGWCKLCWVVTPKFVNLAKRQGCYGGWLKRYGVKDV